MDQIDRIDQIGLNGPNIPKWIELTECAKLDRSRMNGLKLTELDYEVDRLDLIELK